jgi:hypothetical protein
LVCLPSNGFADVTLSDIDAAKITVKLEQGEVCSDQLVITNKIIKDQTTEINKCEEEIKEYVVKESTYVKDIDAKDKIIKDQAAECDKLIKESKGSFWSRLKGNLEVFGVGGVTGAIIIAVIILLH